MKNLFFNILLFLFCITTFISCDDDSIFTSKSKTVNGVTTVSGIRPGGLEKALFLRLGLVTHLVITDAIDSRDFATMRDDMPNLSVLDLSNATIVAYNGYEGTGGTMVYRYSANAIPEYAFYDPTISVGNKKLTTIILPNSIKSIRDFAFNLCSGLSGTLEIPASVKDSIGKSAFGFCENLTGLKLSACKFIGESAFQGCLNLTGTLQISDTKIMIKPWAFANCDKLTAINIPALVVDSFDTNGNLIRGIEVSAFNGCSGMFTVDAANASYSSLDGVLFNKDQSTLIQFPKSKTGSYSVPTTVGTIGTYSFANCTGLTSILFPITTTTIEDYAFSGCTGLYGAFSIAEGITSLGQYVFDECSKITSFDITPANTTFSFADGVLIDIVNFTIKRCVYSKSGTYIVPTDITSIDRSAFSNCSKLYSITFPETLSSIGLRAFYNCSNLTDIYLKSAPIDISYSAFEGVNKSVCTLHVPIGTKAIYQTTLFWNEFKKIVEN